MIDGIFEEDDFRYQASELIRGFIDGKEPPSVDSISEAYVDLCEGTNILLDKSQAAGNPFLKGWGSWIMNAKPGELEEGFRELYAAWSNFTNFVITMSLLRQFEECFQVANRAVMYLDKSEEDSKEDKSNA